MNIINIEHISKIFGEKVIFEDASFGIQQGDKIGIVGINGTGKSTVLRMIAGEEEPDQGQIIRQNGLKIAYLPQSPHFPKGATVASYVLSGNGDKDWLVQSNMTKLGIEVSEQEVENLSGGQRRKLALAKVLAGDFDVLLLDEPTNHLDEGMINWLEEYLKGYKGVLVMVTHDRYFLDKVSNRILEISRGNMYGYDSNYSRFLELKAEREEMELASERKRQSILRMELEWAKRGCRARSTKQRARLDRLEALKQGKAPISDAVVEMDSVETRMGKKTIELYNVTKRYGDQLLLKDFTYTVLRNQRLGIVGPNGCGKSTLLKIMAGLEQPDEGHVEVGETITRHTGYRSRLSKLSGGEKRRLYLLSVLVSGANVLILDEPSNDVDIPTVTILEDYLNAFSGIVITVSHDRYFLDNVVDRIFEFDGNGTLRQYEGGYTDYREAKERRFGETGAISSVPGGEKEKKERFTGKDWKQNRPTKLKFTYKEQREYETIDDDIAVLEEKIEKLNDDMVKNATNSGKLAEIMREKEAAEAQLEEKMDRWVYLNDLAEQIEAQKSGN